MSDKLLKLLLSFNNIVICLKYQYILLKRIKFFAITAYFANINLSQLQYPSLQLCIHYVLVTHYKNLFYIKSFWKAKSLERFVKKIPSTYGIF